MLKKCLLIAALALVGAIPAAAQEHTTEVAYDTYTVYGIWVTSGSTTDLTNIQDPGFKPATITGWRFQNQGSSEIFYGPITMSTNTAAGTSIADLGTKLKADDSSVEQVWAHTDSGRARVYAQAEDDAGATQVPVAVTVYGNR